MSTPEHRRGAGARVDPRLLLLVAFLLGALVSGVAVAVLAHGSDGTSPNVAKTVAGTSSARPKADTGASARPSPSRHASATGGGPEQWALMTKPLTQLQPGDRVVYNMVACHFRSWVGGATDVALIACPGEQPFQTKTESLVPVEPATGD